MYFDKTLKYLVYVKNLPYRKITGLCHNADDLQSTKNFPNQNDLLRIE